MPESQFQHDWVTPVWKYMQTVYETMLGRLGNAQRYFLFGSSVSSTSPLQTPLAL